MITRSPSRRSQLLAALLLAVCAAPATTGGSTGTTNCRNGLAAGLWDLPGPTSTGPGVVDGFLHGPATTSPTYHFVGSLTPVPSPCLSCIEGRIQGTLDDGVGSGPDYHVAGRYLGSFVSGQGQFSVRILSTTAAGGMGSIVGTFEDNPANDGPGTFRGRWRICP